MGSSIVRISVLILIISSVSCQLKACLFNVEYQSMDTIIIKDESLEKVATFRGGYLDKFIDYVHKEYKVPLEYKKLNLKANLLIYFVIDSVGIVSDIKIERSSGYKALDEEAIRVLKYSPKWTPAIQEGKPINKELIIRINIKTD